MLFLSQTLLSTYCLILGPADQRCSLLGTARLQVHILFLWRYKHICLFTRESVDPAIFVLTTDNDIADCFTSCTCVRCNIFEAQSMFVKPDVRIPKCARTHNDVILSSLNKNYLPSLENPSSHFRFGNSHGSTSVQYHKSKQLNMHCKY